MDVFANHLINIAQLEDFTFVEHRNDEITSSERITLRRLGGRFINKQNTGFVNLMMTESSNVFNLKVATKDPEFSQFIAATYYQAIVDYSESKKHQEEKDHYEFVKKKATESVIKVDQLSLTLSKIKDKGRNLISQIEKLKYHRVQRQLSLARKEESIYGNRLDYLDSEIKYTRSKFTILNQTVVPLEIKAEWKIKVIGVAIISFLASIFLIIMRKVILDELQETEDATLETAIA